MGKYRSIVGTLIVSLVFSCFVMGCEGCSASQKAQDIAAVKKYEAVVPRLEQAKKAFPADAADIQVVIESYKPADGIAAERSWKTKVDPVLDRLDATLPPADKQSIDDVQTGWEMRLKQHGQ